MSEYFDADGEPTVLGRARARYGSDERGGWPDPHRRRSFDAALAAHDRQVKAEALREAARDASGRWNVKPYVDQWLAARADRIEGQETP